MAGCYTAYVVQQIVSNAGVSLLVSLIVGFLIGGAMGALLEVTLIQRMYTGLAHYHFHAHQLSNADYAGPGPGDLGFVDRLRTSAVVFTFLDRDTLGVDYYHSGGVIVDLGVIRR